DRIGHRGAAGRAPLPALGVNHEALRIRHGQRPRQQRPHATYHDPGGADAERDGEGSGNGESRSAREGALGVAQIAAQVVEPAKATSVAPEFLGGLETPEVGERRAPCLVRRHATTDAVFDVEGEMGAELIVHVALDRAAPQQARRTAEEAGKRREHGYPPCSTWLTASEKRRHCSVSSASSWRPAAVTR